MRNGINLLMRKTLASLILLSMSIGLMAEIEKLPSLEWQIQDLEVKVTKKVEGVLDSVLSKNQYAVNVEILAAQPADPEFNKRDDEVKDNAQDEEAKKRQEEWAKELEQLIAKSRDADKKLEETVAQAEQKAEERKKVADKKKDENQQKSNSKIKYTDVAPDEGKYGDNIVLSKFGMEVPLVDDFNDLKPDGKILLTMNSNTEDSKAAEEQERLQRLVEEKENEIAKYDREIQKKEREFSLKEAALVNKIRMTEMEANQKLNSKNKEISPVEQIWKYNTAVDVFKNLKEVNIRVRLSKGLSEELKQKVEGYVRSMKFNLGRVNPKIKFEYAILGSDLQVPTKEQVLKEWIDLLSKYATPVGIIIAVILLGIVGTALIKKYFELNSGVANSGNFKMENKGGDTDDKEKELEATGGGAGGLAGESIAGVFGLNGVERFKFYIKSAPNDAILLIKKWLSSDERGAKDALKAIVQQMENDDLSMIFSKLSSSQKVAWRELLNQPLMANELSRANDFISSQIIQNVIIPSAVTDPATYDLVLKLTPDRVVHLVKHEPKMAAILMNILSGSFINEVLAQCASQDRERIINESINVTPEEIAQNQDNLKRVLHRIVDNKDPKPFLDKLLGLVHLATPDVEDSLHKALGKNFTREQLKALGMEMFPAALITELPVGFIKSILMNYPMEKRMRLLYSLDEETQTFFTNVIAPQGSKAQDMINVEFEKIESDAMEIEKIQQDASLIWAEFVGFVRKEIKTDKTYSRDVSELITAWAEDMYQEPQGARLERVS